jgi:hypothetical protein
VSVPGQNLNGSPIAIPSGTTNITLPDFWAASGAFPNGCQAATFSVMPGGGSYDGTGPAYTFTP